MIAGGSMKKEEAVGELLEETAQLLEDLYQGGFSTVSEGVERELEWLCVKTSAYGMECLSQLLTQLLERYRAGRHRMQGEERTLLRAFAMACTYVETAKERNAHDAAAAYYGEK